LAEQIKALRAANTVEATQEWTGKRKVADEEPVTARILRRSMEEPTAGVEAAEVAADKRVAERG
jgi:hypothetical protein